ncbi:MAG: hypothetical protein AMJ58_08110 [Gammaproteobacteria bacterium SG8_30]|nr:MAG: hypothetical protein AMJ58_08110 [Gammaproteobacteria bacterium SG8_30]
MVAERATPDLAISARWILPVEPAGATLEEHAVLVRGGRIEAIVPADRLPPMDPERIVSRPQHVLLPGLVNAHTHAAMSLLRATTPGPALDAWLRERVWPLEARLVSPDFVADGTELAIAEMLLGGITCFADMYFHPEVAARVARSSGVRAVIGVPIFEQATRWTSGLDDSLGRCLELHDRYRSDALVGTSFALHSSSLTTDATLAHVRTLADQLQCPVMIHLLEAASERPRVLRNHGRGPLERLEAAGLLNDLLVAVHCVHASAAEIERIAHGGASVVHCPASNLRLGNGIAPVSTMREAGVNVALGTDGAASNDSLDILAEARLAALLACGSTGNGHALSAHEALGMATLAGARSLGLADVTGSLLPGKWADIACMALHGPAIEPVTDVAEAVIHAAGRAAVSDVWIAGRCVVRDRRLVHIDTVDLMDRCRHQGARVVAALAANAGQ